jgi:ribosomal protein L32
MAVPSNKKSHQGRCSRAIPAPYKQAYIFSLVPINRREVKNVALHIQQSMITCSSFQNLINNHTADQHCVFKGR